jgi:uncharacterized membrane protein (DUF373 family)
MKKTIEFLNKQIRKIIAFLNKPRFNAWQFCAIIIVALLILVVTSVLLKYTPRIYYGL